MNLKLFNSFDCFIVYIPALPLFRTRPCPHSIPHPVLVENTFMNIIKSR